MRDISRISFALGAAILIAASGCVPADDATAGGGEGMAAQEEGLTAERRGQIADAITQRHQDMLDVWAQEDAYDAWAGFFAAEDHAAWAADGPQLVVTQQSFGSMTQIESVFRDMLSDRTTTVTVQDESVAVLSDDAAVHFADITYTVTRAGEISEEYAAAATSVWVMEAGEWKLLHYHQSRPLQMTDSAQ